MRWVLVNTRVQLFTHNHREHLWIHSTKCWLLNCLVSFSIESNQSRERMWLFAFCSAMRNTIYKRIRTKLVILSFIQRYSSGRTVNTRALLCRLLFSYSSLAKRLLSDQSDNNECVLLCICWMNVLHQNAADRTRSDSIFCGNPTYTY